MRTLPARYDPALLLAESVAFWTSRSIGISAAPLGRAGGARVHGFIAPFSPPESPTAYLGRVVRADAEARYLASAGRRPSARLLDPHGRPPGDGAPAVAPRSLGVILGANPAVESETPAPAPEVQELVGRLALREILVAQDLPVPACYRCRAPRAPESVIYEDESAPLYLVRFPLTGELAGTSLLVAADCAWRLLGTVAVLLHPERPYVRVRVERRGTEEWLLLARDALDRVRQWAGEAAFEVLEEKPGSAWGGVRYVHPLATEFPALANLPAPAGTTVPSTDVTAAGTGVVALVPAHGGADHRVAHRIGVPGWPVLTTEGNLVREPSHKYAGLPLDVAEAFITRDLAESGLLFGQVTTRRGVPHCGDCGSPLVWQPGRLWLLRPDRLPASTLEVLQRLHPGRTLTTGDEGLPWPASGWGARSSDAGPEMLECVACGRLAPAEGPARCSCGGSFAPVRRPLVAAFAETLAAWSAERPFAPGEAVRLYLPQRHDFPLLVLHLVAMTAAGAAAGEVRVATVPTLVEPEGLPALRSSDALRAALLRTAIAPRAGGASLANRVRQEDRRLRKVWQVAADLLARIERDGYAIDTGPIGSHLSELEEEDRALLSLFERMRLEVFRDFDLGAIDRAQERLARFFEDDLRRGYLGMVRPRLQASGLPPSKATVYRLLAHILPAWAELAAPIAPATMEAIHRAFRGDAESLVERPFTPIQEMALDAKLETSYRQWRSIAAALRQYRRELGVAPTLVLPPVVLFVREEGPAEELREASGTIARLIGVASVEVASPNEPWEGKRVEAHPVLAEIQKTYPTQAPRVARLIAGMNGRRVQEGVRSHSLELVLEGHPTPILPSMVEFTESLPPGVVPVPWELGELFVTVPNAAAAPDGRLAPALTPDGFRVFRALRRRLDRSPTPSAAERIILACRGSLAEELERHATALSRYFDDREVTVRPDPSGFPTEESYFGRTRRGEPWALWIPGIVVPARHKTRARRPHRPRVPPLAATSVEQAELDFASPELVAREAAIRLDVAAFDRALGRPLMSPAKLAAARDAGFSDFDSLAQAEFGRLAGLPGFGPVIAAAFLERFQSDGVERPVSAPRSPAPAPLPADGPRADLRSTDIDSTEPDASPDHGPAVPVLAPEPAPATTAEADPPSLIGMLSPAGPSTELPLPIGPTVSLEPAAPDGVPGESGSPPLASSPASGADPSVPLPGASDPSSDGMNFPDPPVMEPPPNRMADEASPEVPLAEGEPPFPDEKAAAPTLDTPPPEEPPARVGPEASVPIDDVTTPRPLDGPSAPPVDRSDANAKAEAIGEQQESDASPASFDEVPIPPDREPVPEADEIVPADPAPPDAPEGGEPPGEILPPADLPFPEVSDGAAPEARPDPPESVPDGPAVESNPMPATEPLVRTEATEAGPTPLADEPEAVAETAQEATVAGPAGPEPAFEAERTDALEASEPAPPPPSVLPPLPAPVGPMAGLELWSNDSPEEAWRAFLEATGSGHRGLCLSREFPDRLRAFLGPRDAEVYWLSNVGRERSIRPSDLGAITELLHTGLERRGVTAIFLEGVEYLLRVHGIDRTVGFLRALDTESAARDARVWLPLNPALIDPAHHARLAKELRTHGH
jgi:hypothetical protein